MACNVKFNALFNISFSIIFVIKKSLKLSPSVNAPTCIKKTQKRIHLQAGYKSVPNIMHPVKKFSPIKSK